VPRFKERRQRRHGIQDVTYTGDWLLRKVIQAAEKIRSPLFRAAIHVGLCHGGPFSVNDLSCRESLGDLAGNTRSLSLSGTRPVWAKHFFAH
jgi:hypothetical protein